MATRKDFTMLTTSQSLILLGQQLSPDSPMNNMAFAFTFREDLEVERFRAAFHQLLGACDGMQMTIRDGQPVFNESTDFSLPVEDYRRDRDPDQRVRDYISGAVTMPFVSGGRLFDAVLFLQPEYSVFYLNQHHLITDGWGYAVQMDYLLAVYDGDSPGSLPSFADYIKRAVAEQQSDKSKANQAHWNERVKEYPQPPALFGRVNTERRASSVRLTRQLSREQMERLTALCLEPDVRAWTTDLALFNVFLTAVFAYVCRVSGQHDLVIGAPAHNRVTADDKRTAGLFMELFPLRVQLTPEDTLGDVLAKVKIASMEFLRNAQPGSSTVETGRSFNVLLNFINQAFHDGERPIKTQWLHSGEAEPGHHFRLQVYDFDKAGRLTLSFDVNTAVVGPGMENHVVNGVMDLLDQLVENRRAPLHQLGERESTFLQGTEPTPNVVNYPDATVTALFEQRVVKHPEKVAIRFLEHSMTYAELNARANELARSLHEWGIERGDVVPLCLDRSFGMMVGLLGIMKAGAAYLPLDPGLPDERIAFIGQDAGAKVFVCNPESEQRLRAIPGLEFVVLDVKGALPAGHNLAPSNLPLHLRPRPDDLIYVLYTSGSTGTPKGVMNQHDGLVNHLEWSRRNFVAEDKPTVFLQKTTFTFDVSAWELFLPLISGSELVLARPGGEKDADYLAAIVRQHSITTLHFVPPMLESFLLKKREMPSLHTVICSGEALLPHQVNAFKKNYPDVALHNLYGPTEAAIHVAHWEAPNTPVATVPIGKAPDNVLLRVYGPEGQLRPVGVPGELYLGGVQVARGYLNRPELTAEKFVEHDGQRWYRSGDLVRWQPDGDLEYLGRIDNQVKLRGFRIELGEIEARLLDDPQVDQAVVLLKTDAKGEPALVAYLVGDYLPNASTLRAQLTANLPAYMVPALFVPVGELPMLPNGKINRRALPDPVFDHSAAAAGDEPRGDFEEMLHAAWAETFEMAAIGRETHFLDLGGHSLTGIRMMNRINEGFSLQLPANFVFRFPTIALQAVEIERTIRELMAAMDKS